MDGLTDGVNLLPVDVGQPLQSVVSFFRQCKDLRQQTFGFQGQGFVPQVVVGHNGVICGFLDMKYWHGIHISFLDNS